MNATHNSENMNWYMRPAYIAMVKGLHVSDNYGKGYLPQYSPSIQWASWAYVQILLVSDDMPGPNL